MRNILLLLLLSLGWFNLFSQESSQSFDSYDEEWPKVYKLELQGLTRSADSIVSQIYHTAKKDLNEPQIVKALIYQSKFSNILEEDGQLILVNLFIREIDQSKAPLKNILESVLAEIYQSYYINNRYRYYQRSRTAVKVDSVDFRTWDQASIIKEIHKRYQNSLKSEQVLQNTGLSLYDDLLHAYPESKEIHPTLYDFLVHRAINHYKNSDLYSTDPINNFVVDDPKLLSDNDSFASLHLGHADSSSFELHALQLFQKLTAFHLIDSGPEALVMLTLDRLSFIRAKGVFEEKDALYYKALEELKDEYTDHEVSTEIDYQRAVYQYQLSQKYEAQKKEEFRWKAKEAIDICQSAIDKYASSGGSINCRVLINTIESPAIAIQTEEFVSRKFDSKVLVTYKNTKDLYFSVYKVDFDKWSSLEGMYRDSVRLAELMKLKRVKNWHVKLPDEQDYQGHTTEVIVPKLGTGHYIIVASIDQKLNVRSTYGIGHIQVTDILLVTDHENGKIVYQVVDRNTGRPLREASVYISNIDNDTKRPKFDRKFTTDRNGIISFYANDYYYDVTITIDYKNDLAIFRNSYIYKHYRDNDDDHDVGRIFLFTDRSIYRPGQIVFYKGIAMSQSQNKSKALPNKVVTVDLDDVNGQTIRTIDLTTNEFGSVSGSFILPSGGLTGEFTLDAYFDDIEMDEDYSTNYISVEEYKRPRFQAEFDQVDKTYRLNDTIEVVGSATSFSGSNVTDAKVEYTVTRSARYPRWIHYIPPSYTRQSPSQEIEYGEVTTDESGKFTIKFPALPDPTISAESQPVFTYEVSADVTDINGETRSASSSISVGYHVLEIHATLPRMISKQEVEQKIQVSTKNLNGAAVPTEGVVEIYKLKPPERVTRERPWQAPDFPIIAQRDFIKKFPYENWTNEGELSNLMRGERVARFLVNTANDKEISLGNIQKWKSGKYILVFNANDRYNQPVKDEQFFTLYDPNAKRVADNELFSIGSDRAIYAPGDKVLLHIGSAAKDMSVTIVIERKNNSKKTQVVRLKNNIKTISIPVGEKDRGGLLIHYRYVYHNSFVSGTLPISVPYPKHDLKIETLTFRDKLNPAEEETWQFKLTGPKSEVIATEVLASMYDASLDEFKQHNWRFNPVKYTSIYGYNQASASYSLRNGVFNFHNLIESNGYRVSYRRYDRLKWFGFNLNNKSSTYSYLRSLRTELFSEGDRPGTISGIVLDNSGEPMIGASIRIEGTDVGTISDLDGSYTIAASPGDVLIVSYTGYSDTQVEILKKVNDYNIIIGDETMLLDEVVVTGLAGTAKGVRIRGYSSLEENESEMLSSAMASVVVENDTATMYDPDVGRKESAQQLAQTLQGVTVRKNLQETAFFYPHLTTDSTGVLSFSFTSPESLTSWKLQLLGHTNDARIGSIQHTAVTQKELMVIPNPPRFLREGDEISIQTKIASLTDQNLNGVCELQLFDAITEQRIDHLLKIDESLQPFSVSSNGNTEISWNLNIPEGIQAIQYRIVAKAGDFSDGEENVLPVLSNRMLVTETLPMWLRSNQTKYFTLDKLRNNQSKTLKHHKLTLEVTNNPAWYAIQSLPYLMEYPYECSEQTFARLYANALGSHIATSNPSIKKVFDLWASADQLISNLEKNAELKSLVIEETPWLRDAQSESQQKKRIALLFDLNRLHNQTESSINKLDRLQHSNGGFSWFEGGRYSSLYITQHILTGFGHLSHLGVQFENQKIEKITTKALSYVDQETIKRYKKVIERAAHVRESSKTDSLGIIAEKNYLEKYEPSHLTLQYLYLRSFHTNVSKSSELQKATDYFVRQSYKFWLKSNLYSKGMIALIAYRNGDQAVANAVLAMLQQNAIYSEELGMYWKANQPSYHWYRAPIETHSLMIEVFSEIANDTKAVDELRVWLLKNKQTNSWKTTKQTTSAIYALLLKGTDWLANTDFVDIKIGSENIDPMTLENSKIEAGTGYYKTSWTGSDITPEMANVTLSKETEGISWGGLYWQYFEDLDKITSASTPLQLSKTIFVKSNTNQGELITEIKDESQLSMGDLIRVRIVLKVDREMEFVHMKDMRGAGLEPVDVLSEYKYQDGLYYYQSTKDAATNFFFDHLRPGVYVFEYNLRVNNKGDFSNGITSIQSMYAPEFSSHSEGVRVKVE